MTREDLFEADVSRLVALLRANEDHMSLLKDSKGIKLLESIERYFNDN